MSPSPSPRSPLTRIGHVCIEVAGLDRSAPFYDRFLGRLGFHPFVREAGYVGYSNGELTVWVVQESSPRVRRHPLSGEEEVVADHLAFLLPSREEVAAVQADLERQEVYPVFRFEEHPEFRPGYVSATWTDPDHAVLEVYYVPPPKATRTPRRRRRSPKPTRSVRKRRTVRRRRRA